MPILFPPFNWGALSFQFDTLSSKPLAQARPIERNALKQQKNYLKPGEKVKGVSFTLI